MSTTPQSKPAWPMASATIGLAELIQVPMRRLAAGGAQQLPECVHAVSSFTTRAAMPQSIGRRGYSCTFR